MNKEDKKTWIMFWIIIICLTIFMVVLEVNVQNRWDKYEENVFIERGIK